MSKALDRDMPDVVILAILNGKTQYIQFGHYQVKVEKEDWPNKAASGYDLKFEISLI